MEKKELKEYIKQNGFFLKTNADIVTDKLQLDKVREKYSTVFEEIPDGDNVMVFEALFSQNYKKGEKSRNGYKILQDGRRFDEYKLNNIFLYQHNDLDPIGRTIAVGHDKKGNLIGAFYVLLDTIKDEATKNKIKAGLVKGVSTGHITEEDGIQDNKTGEILSVDEAVEKRGYAVISALWGNNDDYTYVVKQANLLEVSLVTIGSNEKAQAFENSLQSSIQNKYSSLINHTMDQSTESSTTETTENTNTTDTTEEVVEEVAETTETNQEESDTVGKDTQAQSQEDSTEINQIFEIINGLVDVVNTLSEKVETLSSHTVELQNSQEEIKKTVDYIVVEPKKVDNNLEMQISRKSAILDRIK